jgi:hypothetical protein
MKGIVTILLIATLSVGLAWTAHQATVAAEPPLSKYVPSGALLYLQAKDFSSLLADWNGSPQKREWLGSSNYEVFSRSRLFLRLREAGKQFATAAGLPPDMNFLSQVAGSQSALALYDIGKLQFLYITRLPSANSMQSQLWQTRAKFETRNVGDATFYVRRDPESEREVEFAVSGNYLLLATREDLMAGALQLMAGSKDAGSRNNDRSIEAEPWWAQSVAAAGAAGDLRMVLNLDKIVPSPYFRSYWVQQNITDMKRYAAAVSDLFRSSQDYREERVLLKKAAGGVTSANVPNDVSDLIRLVPEKAGAYQAEDCPSIESCFDPLETKILAPHLGPAPPQQLAPQAQLTSGETGTSSDLETRIDEPPMRRSQGAGGASPLKQLLQKNQVRAVLQVQSTERSGAGVFVRIHTAVALAGGSDWDEPAVRAALTNFVRPNLTASELGVGWRQANGYYEFDGLQTLLAAVRGKYLLVSDDSALISGMLANVNRKSNEQPAVFAAGFNHKLEGANFNRFAAVVDRPDAGPFGNPGIQRQPQFFSENIATFSATLAAVSSENIVVRDTGDKVLQTVTYQWSQ